MARPGRPEASLDPGAGPAARFGSALRQLRENAGSPTYRQLAARPGVHFSASVLSTAANGRKIPPWEHVRAYVIACEGTDCLGALKYWKRQWRRYLAESGEQCGDAGTLPAADREAVRWRRLLATVGTSIGVGTAAVVLLAGSASPPPATHLELAFGCRFVSAGSTVTQPVRIPPGYLDGRHYRSGYRVELPRVAGKQKVACAVPHDVRSSADGLVTGVFRARIGIPDGLASGAQVTVAVVDYLPESGPQTFGGPGGSLSVEVSQAVPVPPQQQSLGITFEFTTSSGEAAVVIVDPTVTLLRWL